MTLLCRVCRRDTTHLEYEFYPGFGRLCASCDERAEIVRNVAGQVINVSVEPEA
jgi:hypothetical protein